MTPILAPRRRPTQDVALLLVLLWLFCTPVLAQQDTRLVERPIVGPRELPANLSTTVTATARIAPSPLLIPTSVTLVRYDESGKVVATLGRMVDDGTGGDALVGDGVYTLKFQVLEAKPQALKLRASVAYKGALARTLSEPATVFVQSTATAEETLANLAGLIATGDTDGALRYFTASAKNRDVIAGLAPDQRAALAAAFRDATLVSGTPNKRVYLATLTLDGAVQQREFSLSRTMLNEWFVMSW